MAYFRKIGLAWLVCSLIAFAGQAQKIYSEEEITQERLFLEAYEKKIQGKYEEAIAMYEKLYEQSPGNHAAAFELARIYEQQGNATEAIRWMKLAQSKDPLNTYYQEFLATLFQSAGRFSEAADVYQSLAQKSGGDYYYYRWAYYLVRANKIDDAIKVYDELEKLTGVNEETVRRKHALYLGKGNTKKAVRELEKLIEKFPNSVDYQFLLAAFYEQVREKKKAREVYQKILRLEPGNAKAQMALAGRSASTIGDLEYLASLRSAFEQSSVKIDLKLSKLIPIIQKIAEQEHPDLTEACLELTDILEQVHPDEAKAYSASGDLLFYSGRLSEAREKYQQTLKLDESVYSVWEQLAMTYLLEGNFKMLFEASNDAVDLFPNKAKLYYFNGLAAIELGKNQDAQDMLDQAVLMSSKDDRLKQQILSSLGEAYTALGDFEEADRVFSEALQLDQQSPETLARYSLSLSAREGTQARALEMAEQAIKNAKSDYPMAIMAKGVAMYQNKDYPQAKASLQKALEITQERLPRLLENYGDVLFQLGETEEALNYWQKASEQGRQTRSLEKKINDRKI